MQGVQQADCRNQAGSMVNILSVSAMSDRVSWPPMPPRRRTYQPDKNAANMLRHHNIRVNGVAPGWMDTPAEDDIQRHFHGAGDDWREIAAKICRWPADRPKTACPAY